MSVFTENIISHSCWEPHNAQKVSKEKKGKKFLIQYYIVQNEFVAKSSDILPNFWFWHLQGKLDYLLYLPPNVANIMYFHVLYCTYCDPLESCHGLREKRDSKNIVYWFQAKFSLPNLSPTLVNLPINMFYYMYNI